MFCYGFSLDVDRPDKPMPLYGKDSITARVQILTQITIIERAELLLNDSAFIEIVANLFSPPVENVNFESKYKYKRSRIQKG